MGGERKTTLCHYEVVRPESPHATDKSFTIRQNAPHIGREGPIRDGPVTEVLFADEGPDISIWLVRKGKAYLLAQRRDKILTYPRGLGIKFHTFDGFRIHVKLARDRIVKRGDGFVILGVDEVCRSGPQRVIEGHRHPTVYED